MNIFKQVQRHQALKKIQIESSEMLECYKILKSIELSLTGQYDYRKYKRLKNLTSESFEKEAGDLKLAVRSISSQGMDGTEILKCCLFVSLKHALVGTDRAECVKEFTYRRQMMWMKDSIDGHMIPVVEGVRIIQGQPTPSSPLFETDAIIILRFLELRDWLFPVKY